MKNMLSEALCEVRGLLNQLFTNLAGEQGAEWLTEFKKFLRKEKCWMNMLLEPMGIYVIPANARKFLINDYFVVNTREGARVKIAYLTTKFQKYFLGKVERRNSSTTLRYYELMNPSTGNTILLDLGSEEKAETTLAEMYYLMSKQARGEEGTLLPNSYANIFYIRDISGDLRVASCRWDGEGWYLDARPVSDSWVWDKGRQVFIRNF